MPRRRLLAVTALVAAWALAPARVGAQPAGRALRIAIYAPWAGPTTADQRHALALAIERGFADAGLAAPAVASYAKLGDFRRAVTAGSVDLALVDSGAAIALGQRLTARSSWSSGEPWLLAGAPGVRLRPGERLALQASDAGSSAAMVGRLLRGQLAPGYWSATVGAPVTADARELVLRGKADVVILPRRLRGDLSPLIDLGGFSELVLATTGGATVTAQARQLVESVISDRLGGRWRAGGPRFPTPVAPTRLAIAAPDTPAPSLLDLIAPLSGRLPELDVDQMWMEPNAR